jgi:excinuclease ABC subunit C
MTLNRSILESMPDQPGIYQMLNKDQCILYVGKSGSLKKRLSAYFKKNTSVKTQRLMSQVNDIKIIITQNEHEALLLEAKFIKKYHPRYNILLRDDKSYPYLYLSIEDQYPRAAFYRGKQDLPGLFFGPYTNAGMVRDIINLLQKIFKIRICTNHFFSNRSRPCLQYQLKRCSAPCVNYVSRQQYDTQISQVKLFLSGDVGTIIESFRNKMKQASESLEYEQAAYYRNCIHMLCDFQKQQVVSQKSDFLDIIGFACVSNVAALSVMSIRYGQLFGSKNFTVDMPSLSTPDDVLDTLLIQYYQQQYGLNTSVHVWPKKIVLPFAIPAQQALEKAVCAIAGKKIKVVKKYLSRYHDWKQAALHNAEQAVERYLNQKNIFNKKFQSLKKVCGLPKLTEAACFDVSHTQGNAIVASCVVFDTTGPLKNQYRIYNIKNITPGDDVAALSEAIERYLTGKIQYQASLPELLIVDGGKGQLNAAKRVLKKLNIQVMLLGVAKGLNRRPGLEKLFLSDSQYLALSPMSPAFHLIQHIRDESHRFAIKAHRRRLKKKSIQSTLEHIKGVGKQRRQHLIKQFKGLQGLKVASIENIAQVKGISVSLAQRIKQHLTD